MAARGLRSLVLLSLLALAGCGGNRPAPVVDAGSRVGAEVPEEYVVRRGDTLYAIAFRYGSSYQQLAAANGIRPPYVIYPGQRLRIDGGHRAVPTTHTSAGRASAGNVATNEVVSEEATPARNKVAPPPEPDWSATSAEGWRWPARGKVKPSYTEHGKVRKGIDIVGELGQSVSAARSGKVVYAGDGLKAYGLLVIIKHDESYLSAYAYNSKVHVKEGDWVNIGQQIAEMGQRDDGAVMLHFEVRRDGKPQDPLRYLEGGVKP